ncbi:hypothetical protein NE237_014743 [Protea cynaroides]|uniref:Pectinesterase inhibitor domain-containing protein n=1 Tax=Protea cynaroides TaxID=273540 RepID=A0A9Q0KCN2_9MAGN|nr:hypothetical protein NE237_014743 [Protea cynaroides]
MEHPQSECAAAGNKMTSKGLIVSVSLILIVGVVNGAHEKSLSTNMKAVEAICSPTSYKDKCISIIAPVASNSSSSLKDYFRVALAETTEATKLALETSQTIKIENLKRYDELALGECKKFLQFAVEELEEALALLEGNELQGIHDEVYEFRNWLTAVGVYKETCLDQIENVDLKAGMQDGLFNATLLTVNAADIFAELSMILVALNIQVKVKNPNHRKLLNVGEGDNPHWLSERDRWLLEEALPVPDAIVDLLGHGPKVFNSIAAALDAYPKKLLPGQKYVVYVKAGTYKEENLTVHKNQSNVFMYGDGPEKTIITGNKSYYIQHIPTSYTYSFEYANTGPGAKTNGRVNWPTYKLFNDSKDAFPFTAGQMLSGPNATDSPIPWLTDTGIPFYTGFAKP